MADIVSPSFIFGVISACYSVLQFEEAIAAMAGQRAYYVKESGKCVV